MNLRASAELAHLIMTRGTPEQQQALQDVRAEVRKLRARVRELEDMEKRCRALLAACDRNEAHIRANVPHLPPDGGTFSVHQIRRLLAEAEAAERAQKPAETAFWEAETTNGQNR